MKKRQGSEHIPKLDDYELPEEFPFDPKKLRRNPYAGRVKYTHGGPRKGAGRKPASEPVERHTITLFKSQVEYLRTLDPNLSRAIRKLLGSKS